MKDLKSKTRSLVESILNEDFLAANETLKSLIIEAEENREEAISNDLNDDDTLDPTNTDADPDTDDAADNDTPENGEEEINTTAIDEPTDGDPNLGDALEDDITDAAVGEAEMSEMSNDVVEINCEINQKIISKLYDKISNLKTRLNEMDLDKDEREYITLETKLSYYGNKLEELQSKTNPAIDQAKVEERIQVIDAALKTLESEIGGEDVDDVKSTDELDEETNENVAEGAEGAEVIEDTTGSDGTEGSEEPTEQPASSEGSEEPAEGVENSQQ